MSDKIKPIRVVEYIQPKLKIDRLDVFGNLSVILDGKPIITIHYIYGRIDNASQWALARQIAKSFGYSDEEIHAAETPA